MVKRLYPYEGIKCSPIIEDYERKVSYDAKGNEVITFEKVKYPLDLYGEFGDWSLNAMMESGINPQSFNIHTGDINRLEGASTLGEFNTLLDEVLAEPQNNITE